MAQWRVKSPNGTFDYREKPEAEAKYADEQARLASGEQASLHLCTHADGEGATQWRDCKIFPPTQYEEYWAP
jgi:hypothetical protein